MCRSNWVIGTVMLLLQGCQSSTPENSTNVKGIHRNIEQGGVQSFLVADTIRVTVPSNWGQIKGEQFTLREDCDNPFCGNMVCYLMPNVDQYTRLKLGELFVQNLNSNYNNFKLIHSEVSTPDSSSMSFDYLLTDNELKLGGTTFIHIKGTVAIVYSFMGYNGENGDYVTFRDKVTKVMGSLEYL